MTSAKQLLNKGDMNAFLYMLVVAGATAQPSGVTPPPPPPGSYHPDAVKPKPVDVGAWFEGLKYPPDALSENREGVVSYQLILDPEGKPNNCRVLESSGHNDLDEMTCVTLMQRARFSPARNEKGEAIGSWYRGRMRWKLPEEVEPAAPPQG